jgi:hypothetical protein
MPPMLRLFSYCHAAIATAADFRHFAAFLSLFFRCQSHYDAAAIFFHADYAIFDTPPIIAQHHHRHAMLSIFIFAAISCRYAATFRFSLSLMPLFSVY